MKLIIKLCLGLSHLWDHKFRHRSQDALNPLCDCVNDTETITHFFLHYPGFHIPRQTLLENIRNINEQVLIQMFLYGNPNSNLAVNRHNLNATTEYYYQQNDWNALFSTNN